MTSSYMALEIIIALHFFLRIIKHWSRLLRVPWTARRSNQSILKEINSDYSLENTDAEAPVLWPFDVNS